LPTVLNEDGVMIIGELPFNFEDENKITMGNNENVNKLMKEMKLMMTDFLEW
jgi:hypothetical protein